MSITIHHLPDMRGPCRGKPFTLLIRESQHASTAGSVLAVLHYTREELEALGDQILKALQADEAHQFAQEHNPGEPTVLVYCRDGNWVYVLPHLHYVSKPYPTETDARRAAARTGFPFPRPSTAPKSAARARALMAPIAKLFMPS